MRLDIAILGAGFAGAAAALFLERQGHDVCVYEKIANPSPVGAGIVVQPSGMLVLDALGLGETVRSRAANLKQLYCITPSGTPIAHLEYGELYPGRVGHGTHRGLLFAALHEALTRTRVRLELGWDASALSATKNGWRITFENEAGAVESSREHQLVVVANGATSNLRKGFPMLARDKPYPWGALWFVGKDPERVYRDELFQVADGTRGLYGMLPTGKLLHDPANLTSLFWSVAKRRVDEVRRAGLPALREQVLALDPRAEVILDQIDDMDQLLFSDYHDVVMHPFHDRNIVFIGDAAHAASPQLGQGTNLALRDALVLGRCVARASSIDSALEVYSAERRPHLDYYQFASRWLTPLFQSDYAFLGPIRDALMSRSCRMAWPRQEMLRTMAGGKMGVFRGSFDEIDERCLPRG